MLGPCVGGWVLGIVNLRTVYKYMVSFSALALLLITCLLLPSPLFSYVCCPSSSCLLFAVPVSSSYASPSLSSSSPLFFCVRARKRNQHEDANENEHKKGADRQETYEEQ